MKAGEFPDGSRVLRAKIDMASPNINMRDPVLYRIRHASHHRTGDAWCIYPMYDYAHPIEDADRGHHALALHAGVRGSPAALRLGHRDRCRRRVARSRSSSRGSNLTYTVMSKRKLLQLVQEGHVAGWDDPRMPTISGLRRRGYTPEAIRDFCERIGVAKKESTIDVALLEYCVREDLNKRAPRAMAVLEPLKVVIENYPEGQVEEMDAVNNPEDPSAGHAAGAVLTRAVHRAGRLPRGPAEEVLPARAGPRGAAALRVLDHLPRGRSNDPATGEVVELRCTYDPATRGGDAPDGRKVKATLHWVSAAHAVDGEVRLYDRLFSVPDPAAAEGDGLAGDAQPRLARGARGVQARAVARRARRPARASSSSASATSASTPTPPPARPVFNRTVTLKDSWAKIEAKG